MADKQGLADLQGRAAAALRQRDLVGLAVHLAKTESPTKAMDAATAHGWPTRLAKSVRALAMLRRDHGLKAFEAFVSSFEHARSLLGETEHAQSEAMTSQRRLRAIARLTDSSQKLRLLVKHRLIEAAIQLIDQLLAEREVSFWENDGPSISVVSLETTPLVEYVDSKLVVIFWSSGVTAPGGETNHNWPERDRVEGFSGTTDTVCVRFNTLAAALGWDRNQTTDFARRVLERISRHDQTYRHPECSNATHAVRSDFLAPDDALGRTIDLAILRTRFRRDEVEMLLHFYPTDPTSAQPERERLLVSLERAVGLFRELGLSMDQVREEFLWWLRHRPVTWPSTILGFAQASCFSDPNDEQRYQALRDYLQEAWSFATRANNRSWTYAHVAALAPHGLCRRTTDSQQGDEAFFRAELVTLLSEGKAGKVMEALRAFSDWTGLEPATSWEVQGGKPAAIECMNLLAPDAFRAAYNAGRYGVAAALAKQFSCFPSGYRDRKVEVIQLAEDLEQPIELVASFDVGDALK